MLDPDSANGASCARGDSGRSVVHHWRQRMLRILIADDHEVARRGIRAVLENHPGWEVCGEARDGRESVELSAATKPDLVLLDIGMPNLNGLEAARQILAILPDVAILIL